MTVNPQAFNTTLHQFQRSILETNNLQATVQNHPVEDWEVESAVRDVFDDLKKTFEEQAKQQFPQNDYEPLIRLYVNGFETVFYRNYFETVKAMLEQSATKT